MHFLLRDGYFTVKQIILTESITKIKIFEYIQGKYFYETFFYLNNMARICYFLKIKPSGILKTIIIIVDYNYCILILENNLKLKL